MSKLKQIDLFNPIIFTFSKVNIKFVFIFLPIIFTYGQWTITSVYILLYSFFLLLEKIKFFKKIEFKYIYLFIFLFIAGIIAVTRSVDLPEGVMYFVATIFIPFVLFYTILNSDLSIKDINYFMNVNIVSGVILGFFSIYIVVILGTPGIRIPSIWEDFNIVSAYFMIILFIIITNIIYVEDKRFLILYLFSLIPVLLGLFFTQTRGVWLSVIISLLFYIFKRPKALVPAMILFAIIIMFFYDIVIDRFFSVKNFGTDMSALGRIQAWIASILLLKDHWLLGAGFDSFIELRYTVFDFYLVDVPHSHNTFLRLILELGILGFATYMSFIIISFVYSFKLIKKYKNDKINLKIAETIQLSLFGLLIAFMFEPYLSLYGNSTLIIWSLISIIFYLYKKENKPISNF